MQDTIMLNKTEEMCNQILSTVQIRSHIPGRFRTCYQNFEYYNSETTFDVAIFTAHHKILPFVFF